MIKSTAFIMGGLGNQMFQVAHAVAQGLKNNVPSVFEKQTFTPMEQSKPITDYLENVFRKINFVEKVENKKRVFENDWNDPQLNFSWDTSIEFYGYFQSSKNFFGFDDYIKNLFCPTKEFINKIKTKYPEINSNIKTTSIHVRRGDYLTINNILPTLDVTYFNECIKILDEETDVFFVFSDDVEWVNKNLKNKKIIFVNEFKDYEDLWFMSLCNNNIISNSTFSWWGSFLNKNKDKKVLCPGTWFGPDGPNPHNNIYIDEWTKINVTYVNGKLKYER